MITKAKIALFVLLLGVLAIGGWFATKKFILAPAVSAGDVSDNYTVLVDYTDNELGIKYSLSVDNNNSIVDTFMSVRDLASSQGLKNYTKFANRELSKSLQSVGPKEKVQLFITFQQAIDEVTFKKFIEKYQLAVQVYTMHGLQSDGLIVTMLGTDPVIQQAPTDPDHPSKFLGWVDVTGYVDSNQLIAINNDKLVYVVVAPELFYKSMLNSDSLSKAGIKDKKRQELILKNGFSYLDFPPFAYTLFYENHPELK